MSPHSIEGDIIEALENAPDDGTILVHSFRGAGGPFDDIDNAVPRIEVAGSGRVPGVISPATFYHLKSGFSMSTEPAMPNDAFITADKLACSSDTWSIKVQGILEKLNVHDVFRVELAGLLLSCAGSSGLFPSTSRQDVAGTLVITLPSEYQGGAVQTQHGYRSETFILDKSSGRSAYVAFLNNRLLSVSPIKNGCRVALIYYILHKRPPRPLDPTPQIYELRGLLKRWNSDQESSVIVMHLEEPFESFDDREDIPPIVQSQISFLSQASPPGIESRVGCLTCRQRGLIPESYWDAVGRDPFMVEFSAEVGQIFELDELRDHMGNDTPYMGQSQLSIPYGVLERSFPVEEFENPQSKALEEARQVPFQEVPNMQKQPSEVPLVVIEKVYRCNVLIIFVPGRLST